jgi:FkbM family methyltransferase
MELFVKCQLENYIKTLMVEISRRLVRRLIGSSSRLYKAGSLFLDFIAVAQKDGIRTWLDLKKVAADGSENRSPVPVTLRNLRHPIFMRPGTADAPTVINNIIREEYGNFQPTGQPQWMIDAGAYIGDTAAYFLSRFPELKIIALEPHAYHYEMAARNLAPYGDRAILMRKGLWIDDQDQLFGGEGTGAALQDKGVAVECVCVPTLLRNFSIGQIDILKMDIEGAEKAIFTAKPEQWLGRVNLLIIEIHGPEILSVVSQALSRGNFAMKQYRSVWYCRPIS